MKQKRDKVNDMVQHWADTADETAIVEYAKYKLTEWYMKESDKKVSNLYTEHLEELEMWRRVDGPNKIV
tara:strand:- start:678 stop:884 length:207 start_codon:yes stop_codon:yes gene_type:complete